MPDCLQEFVEQQCMHLSDEDQCVHEAASMVGLEGSAAAVVEVSDITRMHCVAGLALVRISPLRIRTLPQCVPDDSDALLIYSAKPSRSAF